MDGGGKVVSLLHLTYDTRYSYPVRRNYNVALVKSRSLLRFQSAATKYKLGSKDKELCRLDSVSSI